MRHALTQGVSTDFVNFIKSTPVFSYNLLIIYMNWLKKTNDMIKILALSSKEQTVLRTIFNLTDKFGIMTDIISENKDEFEININDRWSAGQDLVHLIKVLKIVNIGFTLPKPILRLIYGINKNNNRSFEQLQMLYKSALDGGVKAPTIYVPKPVAYIDKDNLIQKHASLNKSFIDKLNNHTQYELDSYRLPHPILGKISLGELAIFTSFHTSHHYELLKSKLGH